MSFDAQAPTFDARAGLPAAAAARIADAVIAHAGLAARGRLLEVGAGTGALGAALRARLPGRYAAIDRSLAMLARFRRRPGARAAALVLADADRRWPLADRRFDALFLSRAAHLLDAERLRAEALRALDGRRTAGATIVLGRVERPRTSARARLRRRMRALLAEAGIAGRDGAAVGPRLASGLVAAGRAAGVEGLTVATWPVLERPADALASWRGKAGLAGRDLDPALQGRILDRLEAWAGARFGDLEQRHESEARYRLTVIHLQRSPEGGR